MTMYLKKMMPRDSVSERTAADFHMQHVTKQGDYVLLSTEPQYENQPSFDMNEISRPIRKWWLS